LSENNTDPPIITGDPKILRKIKEDPEPILDPNRARKGQKRLQKTGELASPETRRAKTRQIRIGIQLTKQNK
jgi:hypothetical protein